MYVGRLDRQTQPLIALAESGTEISKGSGKINVKGGSLVQLKHRLSEYSESGQGTIVYEM